MCCIIQKHNQCHSNLLEDSKRKKKETEKLKCTKDGIEIKRSPLDKLEEVKEMSNCKGVYFA